MTAKKRDRSSADSIRARLLERSKREGEEFQRTLVLYANERLLDRLANSSHASEFVLKGASLFVVWTGVIPRATKDVDLLGFGTPSPERLLNVFRSVLATPPTESDGLTFNSDSLRAQSIREDAVYDGVRLTFEARLGVARIVLQVDVGFGDAVEPAPELVQVPSMLDFAVVTLRGYRREVSIPEKFHAIVALGLVNSRMKDYFDIAYLARAFEFTCSLGCASPSSCSFEEDMSPLAVARTCGAWGRDERSAAHHFAKRRNNFSSLGSPKPPAQRLIPCS